MLDMSVVIDATTEIDYEDKGPLKEACAGQDAADFANWYATQELILSVFPDIEDANLTAYTNALNAQVNGMLDGDPDVDPDEYTEERQILFTARRVLLVAAAVVVIILFLIADGRIHI